MYLLKSIQLDNAYKDLNNLETIIGGKKEFEDLKKLYEEVISSAKTDESHLFKKMIKKYKASYFLLNDRSGKPRDPRNRKKS